jgi:cation transport ATPase
MTSIPSSQHAPGVDLGHEDPMTGAEHEKQIETWILAYLVGGVLVFTTTLTRWSGFDSEIALIPAMVGSVLLWLGLARPAFRELSAGAPTSSSLAALAVIAAIAIGRYETAGYVAFILILFDLGLRRTAWGARRAIEELVGLTPDTARLLKPDGSTEEVALSQIAVGQMVRVRPGENLPVDGRIVTGESTINQASLTGEALPVEVQSGSDGVRGHDEPDGGDRPGDDVDRGGHDDRQGGVADQGGGEHADAPPADDRDGGEVLRARWRWWWRRWCGDSRR